jgi:signal transduction histidine kinase
MKDSDKFIIRPAGRHILTIGRDLIQDNHAAIVELVKNAYDADSKTVAIRFNVPKKRNCINITVEDFGHGMTRDVVLDKWLVPSTDDKLKRRMSPGGRTMQGRKGVGRYAASILGDDLLLETISEHKKTSVFVEWKEFEKAEFLDDVEILVNTTDTDQSPGTKLTITGNKNHLSVWDEKQIKKLKFELKKLISPVTESLSDASSDCSFSITLNIKGVLDGQDEEIKEIIEPFPVIDLFDYKISGKIHEDGTGTLIYINQKVRNAVTEKIIFDIEAETECGNLDFDIRVYDREPDAIELLIKRGLTHEDGSYFGKKEAKIILNEYNGIGVYRNDFRIRPMGNPDFDWLKLNEQRVQNPSLKIGSNQVIGYVKIESEEISGLEEKSARDGLRENRAYERLKKITLQVITELENRRFNYRKKAGLSRKALKIEKEFEKLFSFADLKKRINFHLNKSGIDKISADNITKIIEENENEKNLLIEDIKQIVAVYQGQATLGKIINVVLHEGRKPLNFFSNQIPNLNFWAQELKENYSTEALDELLPIADKFGVNADLFVKLFGRLDPLAAKKRDNRKTFLLKDSIVGAFLVFENEVLINNIKYEVFCPADLLFKGWKQDIYIILTNLIDNSIFWMLEKKSAEKIIKIDAAAVNGQLSYIDYRDTGPGIEPQLIESGVIYEPEFSTKVGGTGLGLSIAGEAAARNGLELTAFNSETGVYFRLQPLK